jgi:hypothetical protein
MTLSPACGSLSTRTEPDPADTGPAAWTVDESFAELVLFELELFEVELFEVEWELE